MHNEIDAFMHRLHNGIVTLASIDYLFKVAHVELIEKSLPFTMATITDWKCTYKLELLLSIGTIKSFSLPFCEGG